MWAESTLVNHMVQGLVSHMETDCFWLLVELDRVARLICA